MIRDGRTRSHIFMPGPDPPCALIVLIRHGSQIEFGAAALVGSRAVRPLRLYLLLAFGWSWAIWIPIAVLVGDLSALHYALVAVGAAGPSLAGVLCTAREEGRPGVRRLVASVLAWRLPARWYALAVGGPLSVALLSVAIYQLAVGDDIFSELKATTVLLLPVALVAAVFAGSLQEELGWRGYALRRLLDRCSAITAALLVGVAWAPWHLPLYGMADGQERMPLAIFLVSVVALSLIYTWLWLVTGGSLLIAVVLHSSTNVASVLLAAEAQADLGPYVMAAAATVLLAALVGMRLKHWSHGGYRAPSARHEPDA